MVTTGQLIEDLSRDLRPVRPRRSGAGLAMVWWALALGAAIVFASMSGPWRPGVTGQLLEAPRFALEIGGGLLALASLTSLLFKLATPGAATRRGAGTAIAVSLGWLAILVWNALLPPLEPSMLGKRSHCVVEVVLFALVAAAHGCWLLGRRYPLYPVVTLSGLALVAGLLPALLMQLACMYAPAHGLLYHWLPALVPAALAAAWGLVVRYRHRHRLGCRVAHSR